MCIRLGLDIGTNSIGWWLYLIEGGQISSVLDGGVRIFTDGRDPKSKASLAVDRRVARSMRRRRDRYLRRRTVLMKRLALAGLMPADPEQAKTLEVLDPYLLRAKGLDEPLSLHELGRALFHLNQRRGFKSNRKTDRGENESGKIKDATRRLDFALAESRARTYGEYLHMRRERATDPRRVPPVRTRMTVEQRDGPDSKEETGYDFYPDRRHLEEEFQELWKAQAAHHSDVLSETLRDDLFEVIFYQRSLKAPQVGLCLFSGYPDVSEDAKRLPKAHPLFQRRILYETVNNLAITANGRERRKLTLEERDLIIKAIDGKKPTKTPRTMSVTLENLAKVLKLKPHERFTLGTAGRAEIACDAVRASLSHPDRFGSRWGALDWKEQWDIIKCIREVESDADHAKLSAWLDQTHTILPEQAANISNAWLPEGYGRLGEVATGRILEALKTGHGADGAPLTYSAAVEACGWHHSDHRTGELLDELPYYGKVLERHVLPGTGSRNDADVERYGRITNPTVHIGLNQLRRLVNRIIEVHGKPDEIVLELARDLKRSEQEASEVSRRQNANRKMAEQRSTKLGELGQPDTGRNRMLLRLWEDLGEDVMRRACPYTGQRISATMLFDGSCDVDHILPYSRTLDDSFANRTLCLREANQEKRDRAPFEVWGGSDRWSAIEDNLRNLPQNKRWRFAPDAMEQFEEKVDFLDRALVDTQYLSRISRQYLDTLYTEGGHVWVVPGRMTEMLRRHWGLNFDLSGHESKTVKAKNRTDHRHHAIDAAVIAATDRSLIQRIQQAASRDEGHGNGAEDIARSIELPWEGFRSDVRTQLDRITVSHRADHGVSKGQSGTVGALHEATAMAPVDDTYVATRIPVASIKPGHLVEDGRGDTLRDPYLRRALMRATDGLNGKEFEKTVAQWFAKSRRYSGTRRVRILKTLQQASRVSVPTMNPTKVYKGGSNHRFELWRLPNGKVVSQVITAWEFHNLSTPKRPHPAAKRLLSVHKDDMVAIERDGRTQICRVQKTDIANGAFLVPHNEANASERSSDKNDPFKWFQMSSGSLVKAGIRRVHVDEMGRVRDPGRPHWASDSTRI